jgi:hypothetical protein
VDYAHDGDETVYVTLWEITMALISFLICAIAAVGPVADVNASFPQESATFFGAAQGLPADQSNDVVLYEGAPVVATPGGLATFKDGKWVAGPISPGFVAERLFVLSSGLWAVGEGKAARLEAGNWEPLQIDAIPAIRSVAVAQGLLVGTDDGVWRLIGDAGEHMGVDGPVGPMAVLDGRVFAGTAQGLFELRDDPFVEVYPSDERYGWDTREVHALAIEGGRLWFGAENGAGVLNGKLFTGKEGLPHNSFTCAVPGEAGVVWFGTERGALRYDGTNWAYRGSLRWLPDDRVNGIAVQPDGTAWIATPKGIARIERRPATLASKAAEFERIISERHDRMGFVVRCHLKNPGDFSETTIPHTDNDGLYTSTYGASQAFRYGATKDPEAKARAKRCFDAVKLLFDATGIPGFPARSVIPVDWPVDPNEGFNAETNRKMKESDPLWKEILPRWPRSADGKYYWKCDTSSDEISGHFFFFGAYYDLVAETPEEKAAVVDLTRALTNHIVDNGFKLVDHDGKPTRWGNWSPEYVNSIDGGWSDRGIQAVELLSFLNVALHVTGDQKFADTAKMLRDKYAYHINAIDGRAVFPPENVVPWDNNLAFLSYYGLLKYETDPELLRTYRASLDRNWLFVSRQNDPFFNFVFTAVFPYPEQPVGDGRQVDYEAVLKKGVRTLQGTPQLLLGWEMKNSDRLDVVQDPTPRQREGYGFSVFNEALPIEERCHIRINSDHFDLDHSQGGGTVEYEGSFYLLPYYLGLYHGFLK